MHISIALIVIVGAVVIAVAFWNTGQPLTTNEGSPQPLPTTSGPKSVRFTRSTAREVTDVLKRFVSTAVTGRDISASYSLGTSNLHEGMSRQEWGKGDIPVYRYPAAQNVAISRVIGSYPNDVVLEVLVTPRRGANVGPMTAQVEMKERGSGQRRRWLVDSFFTSGVLPAANAPAPKTKARATSTQPAKPDYGAGHLNAKWLLLPAFILALIFVIPVSLGVRGWYRRRRAERDYVPGT